MAVLFQSPCIHYKHPRSCRRRTGDVHATYMLATYWDMLKPHLILSCLNHTYNGSDGELCQLFYRSHPARNRLEFDPKLSSTHTQQEHTTHDARRTEFSEIITTLAALEGFISVPYSLIRLRPMGNYLPNWCSTSWCSGSVFGRHGLSTQCR